ncbi:MAG: hypothetical protein U0R23_12105 [Candidatus Nanopelagicales bacterium]
MIPEKTVQVPASRSAVPASQAELNQTADRLVLEVVYAVDDGYTGVPECQRLIAWLSAEFLPWVQARFAQAPPALLELRSVLDQMHGSNGQEAARLSMQARALVFRLL